MKQKILDLLNIMQGMRKTIVMLLLMIIGVCFRISGLLSGSEFVDLFRATVISYFGASSAEFFTEMVRTHLAGKNAATASVGALDQAVEAVEVVDGK